MAVIGSLIKGLIDLSGKIEEDQTNASLQQDTLYNLLNRAKHTEFGKHYQFEKILTKTNTADGFKNQLPYFDYAKIHNEWWYKIHQHTEDVVWPGLPDYFALTSGTTGKKANKFL